MLSLTESSPCILLIVDPDDQPFIMEKGNLADTPRIVIPLRHLYRHLSRLAEIVKREQIDMIVYSRNNQVANRPNIGPITRNLKCGYTSFSGIDDNDRLAQMITCYEDLCRGQGSIPLNKISEKPYVINKIPDAKGTFSLIFDTEQLGGVRYGVPRILALLSFYNIRATFFLTGIVSQIYPELPVIIRKAGHEIGIHGRWHEYLSGLPRDLQVRYIKQMKLDLGEPVVSANFIGRMDQTTIAALAESGLKRFVLPCINAYKYGGYLTYVSDPQGVEAGGKNLIMVPIQVETYSKPYLSFLITC